MSDNKHNLELEVAHLRRMVEEFQRLYLHFDETASLSAIEPEDLEVSILSLSRMDMSVNKTRYFEDIVILCEKLGMLDAVPRGLSDLESVKTFIKSAVRTKKLAEKGGASQTKGGR